MNLLSWQIFPASRDGQSFHCSPPPTLSISCILLHNSSFLHVLFYHINPSFNWPASLSSSFHFQLQHFISTSLSLLTICLNHLNVFCLKCSSKSSTDSTLSVQNAFQPPDTYPTMRFGREPAGYLYTAPEHGSSVYSSQHSKNCTNVEYVVI